MNALFLKARVIFGTWVLGAGYVEKTTMVNHMIRLTESYLRNDSAFYAVEAWILHPDNREDEIRFYEVLLHLFYTVGLFRELGNGTLAYIYVCEIGNLLTKGDSVAYAAEQKKSNHETKDGRTALTLEQWQALRGEVWTKLSEVKTTHDLPQEWLVNTGKLYAFAH
mgnify:CR=1 FL=1